MDYQVPTGKEWWPGSEVGITKGKEFKLAIFILKHILKKYTYKNINF
jgi:hypothetical protein